MFILCYNGKSKGPMFIHSIILYLRVLKFIIRQRERRRETKREGQADTKNLSSKQLTRKCE